MGHVKVKNSLAIEYQNDSSSVQEIMDIKLEDKLEHPDHIYEEIGLEQDTYMKKWEGKTISSWWVLFI